MHGSVARQGLNVGALEYQFEPMDPLPIRFVLVETTHPGNIGAVARAMKNMGLTDLVLVNPRNSASGSTRLEADDLLQACAS
jgi:tRNA C32,U32 (ribose-2'-O)-methylase TrmJ